MPAIKIQGIDDRAQGIYYIFDPTEPPLGEGGMGKVYAGRRIDATGNQRPVAIKFMFAGLPENVITRARREASIMIRHPNLVEMYGFIETETISPAGSLEKHYHVVSELLDGVMLDDLLQGKITNRNGQVVPLAEKLYTDYKNHPAKFASYIVRNILSGLMALHDAGYIHRDIDPTNIMITSDGHVKLIDYGIAKQINTLTTNDKGLTVSGVFMGKPEYAAPELVLGDVKSQGITTDIYSVGILLFQCILGYQPFTGSRHEVLHKQLHDKLPTKGIKNTKMREIVAKATEKSQMKRYQSAAEFRVDLDRIPPGREDVGSGSVNPGIIVGAIIGLAIIVAAIFVPWSTLFGGDKERLIDDTEEVEETSKSNNEYRDAVEMLKQNSTAAEGLEKLQQLSADGNSNATFLLSRLYFHSKSPSDVTADSVQVMKNATGVATDNVKAHELLEKSVSQDRSNYKALYELGCDYMAGRSRDDSYTRNTDEARSNFAQALPAAQEANDTEYISLINEKLQRIK